MLNKISLKNFKAFREAQIEIKPITILIGPNNSGKSSLLQSIILIQQTLESSNSVLNTAGKKFGSFDELINQKNENNEIDFRLDFNDKTHIEFTITAENNKTYVKNFSCDAGLYKYSLQNLAPEDYNNEKNIIENQSKCMLEYDEENLKHKKILKFELEPVFLRESFFFKIKSMGDFESSFKKYLANGKDTDVIKIFTSISDSLEFYNDIVQKSNDFYQKTKRDFNDIKYVGPIREEANRSYERGFYNYVGLTGEHAVQILANDLELKNEVEEHFKNMSIARGLEVLDPKAEKNIQFLVKTKITDKGVNFADIGCGTSQILPIIVQSLITKNDSIIIIEQPEVHLHPKVQADLADFFVNVSSKNKKFILETHSDYFIERIRYNIMNGDIKTENVAIYYIEQNEDEKCSTIETININSKGQYSNLPEDYITNFRLKEIQKMTKKLLENL